MPGKAGRRLVDGYDQVIFDLDGVVYLVDQPIPGAPEAIAQLHREAVAVAYATNNASRRPEAVAELLTRVGVQARVEEVLTSARATAEVLATRLPAGAPVLVVGADALRADLRDTGLRPVAGAGDGPVAVVQGYGPDITWADLAEASVAIRAGAMWVATNTDRTLPTARGPLPGNGALVAALCTALEREPDLVVGKPEPALFQTAARRAGARRPLVVGDRLDTDIEGANRSGMDSLVVLTGICTPRDLLVASRAQRPTHICDDLSGLFIADEEARVPVLDSGQSEVAGAGWRVSRHGEGLELTGDGPRLAALRLLCAMAWAAPDDGWGAGGVKATGGGAAAGEVLCGLGLGD